MADNPLLFQANLDNCEKEPIHIPNKIQGHGFLLATDTVHFQIVQCSDNVERFIGLPPEKILGRPLGQLIDIDIVLKIKEALQEGNLPILNPLKASFTEDKISFKLILHSAQNVLLLEAEPQMHDDVGYVSFFNNTQVIVDDFAAQKDLISLCNAAVKQIKRVSGYHRVMLYRFDKEWNGEVLAEHKEAHLNSFLGLHFPATDIPPQARKLYETKLSRLIPDLRYEASALVPDINPLTGDFLDMSQSVLRSVSPLHIEYLGNMGVRATLTVSIMSGGKLWGLFACHHYAPHFIDYRLRSTIEHFAKLFTYHLSLLHEIEDYGYMLKLKDQEANVVKQLAKSTNLALTFARNIEMFFGLYNTDGVVVVYDNHFHKIGLTPDRAVVGKLVNWLAQRQQSDIYYTDSLYKELPEAESYAGIASGLLSMRLSRTSKNFIVWFRVEQIHSVFWGGNPDEKMLITPTNEGYRLSPRKSFEKWEEVVRHHSQPWRENEVRMAKQLYKSLLEAVSAQADLLAEQKQLLEQQVQKQTMELLSLYQELQATNEELQSANEELRVSHEEIQENYDEIQALHTNLKTSLRKLKAIFDSTKDIHFFVDTDFKVLFFNNTAQVSGQRYFYTSQIQEGDNVLDHLSTSLAARETLSANLKRALAGEVLELEEQLLVPPGIKVWFRTELHPVDEDGQIVGVAINITNIDSIKQSEQRIKEQNETLRKIAHMQSHEVRRPIANILGLASILDFKQGANEQNQTVIEKLVESTQELDKVIHKIVDAAQDLDEPPVKNGAHKS